MSLMALSRRQKIALIPIVFYWPVIFIATHIPRFPSWTAGVHVSDKFVHFFMYLILAFFLWFAVNPGVRVNWRKAAVWWVLVVVVWYGVVDEWLQVYVGRNCDVRDFLADTVGAVTGLVLLWIFPFWPATVAMTGTIIFVLTNFIYVQFVIEMPAVSTVFHLCAYAFFPMVWIRCMEGILPLSPPQSRWFVGALTLPLMFLAVVESFSAVAGNGVRLLDVAVSVAAILVVVGLFGVKSLLRGRFI